MTITSGKVQVATPATSANLGPGFDSFGLALNLFTRIEVEVVSDGVQVVIDGEGAESLPRDESNLLAETILKTLDIIGVAVSGLKITAHNSIPQGSGLGSSSSAIVGAIAAARALAGETGAHFTDEDAYQLAVDLEGHPDNVAAAMFGGFTIAWIEGAAAQVARFDAALPVTVFIPPTGVPTSVARGYLPESIAHKDAAENSARSGLLALAITERPELLFSATEDRLHQSFRADAMPASHKLVRKMRLEKIPAVISGAGPTVLAFAHGVSEFCPTGWVYRELVVSPNGVVVE